jgi:hypothetical protein
MDSKPKPESTHVETWIDRVYEPTESDLRGARKTSDLFLNNGEYLTIFQRMGFLFFWLPSIGMGLYLLREAIRCLRELDWTMLVLCPLSAGFLYAGIRGIRNVLRFKSLDEPTV